MGKVFSYKTMLNDEGIPHMVKEQEYDCQKNYMYDNTAEMADFIMWNLKLQLYAEEIVYVIALDSKCHIIGCSEVSHGSCCESFAAPREVFVKALMLGAVNIVVTHNHPSGDITPSKTDDDATKKIKEAGKMLGVNLLDHIIVSRTGCYSYMENGDLKNL